MELPASTPSNPGPVTEQEAKPLQNAAPKKQSKPEPPFFTKVFEK